MQLLLLIKHLQGIKEET
uniref:Uncharacterized protein n=1 Tax=Anguilla anguilla TaxID=7936 RepID=A0A0E9PES6_ANGAN